MSEMEWQEIIDERRIAEAAQQRPVADSIPSETAEMVQALLSIGAARRRADDRKNANRYRPFDTLDDK